MYTGHPGGDPTDSRCCTTEFLATQGASTAAHARAAIAIWRTDARLASSKPIPNPTGSSTSVGRTRYATPPAAPKTSAVFQLWMRDAAQTVTTAAAVASVSGM